MSAPARGPAGLLIVNADDLGGNALATDRIVAAFRAGVITSATAMVHMADSARAAALAADCGLPAGLHLNLTQAYDAATVAPTVVARQRQVIDYMADPRTRRMGFSPWQIRVFRQVVADQLAEFRHLFGVSPTHIDGHNHAHLNPTALLALPPGMAARPAYRSPRRGLTRIPLTVRDRVLSARHPVPEHFFALEAIHPELGGCGLEQALELAEGSAVEIMVHPDRDRTDAVLHSPAWAASLARARLGSYADLSRRT